MNIIGIDPSSKKVAATITFNEARMEMRTLGFDSDIHKACAEAYEWAYNIGRELINAGKSFAVIEEPVVGRGGVYSTLRQSKVSGALVAGLVNAGVETLYVNNQRFKKEVVGNGNANKVAIKEWCKEHWPNAYEMANNDQDLIDSAAINRYGRIIVDRRRRILVRKTQRVFRR